MTDILQYSTMDEIGEELSARPNENFILIIGMGDEKYKVISNRNKPTPVIFHELLTVGQKWIESGCPGV